MFPECLQTLGASPADLSVDPHVVSLLPQKKNEPWFNISARVKEHSAGLMFASGSDPLIKCVFRKQGDLLFYQTNTTNRWFEEV